MSNGTLLQWEVLIWGTFLLKILQCLWVMLCGKKEWYCLICNMDSNPQRASSNAIFTLPNHASAWTPCVIPLSSSAILFSASHHRVQPAVAPNAPLYLLLTATPCFPL
jgi:hypothetical protein